MALYPNVQCHTCHGVHAPKLQTQGVAGGKSIVREVRVKLCETAPWCGGVSLLSQSDYFLWGRRSAVWGPDLEGFGHER